MREGQLAGCEELYRPAFLPIRTQVAPLDPSLKADRVLLHLIAVGVVHIKFRFGIHPHQAEVTGGQAGLFEQLTAGTIQDALAKLQHAAQQSPGIEIAALLQQNAVLLIAQDDAGEGQHDFVMTYPAAQPIDVGHAQVLCTG